MRTTRTLCPAIRGLSRRRAALAAVVLLGSTAGAAAGSAAAPEDRGVVWEMALDAGGEAGDAREHRAVVERSNRTTLLEVTAPPRSRGDVFVMRRANMFYLVGDDDRELHRTTLRQLEARPLAYVTALLFGDPHLFYETGEVKADEDGGDGDRPLAVRLTERTDALFEEVLLELDRASGRPVRATLRDVEGGATWRASFAFDNEIRLDGETRPFLSRVELTRSDPDDGAPWIVTVTDPEGVPLSRFDHHHVR